MTTDIRTRILDAAVQLLETEGAKAFGQTRVARAAGVKQGNITYHFPKKADLVAAVVERVNERRLGDLQDLVERAHKLAPEKLRALVFERLPALAMEVKRSRVMLALLVEGQHDPSIARLLGSINVRQRAALGGLLHRGPDDLDLELVLATLSGLSLHALGEQPDDHVNALLRRFSHWLPTLLPAVNGARRAKRRTPAAAARRS
jgi:AcrR family transcriptional regulator